MSDKLYIRVKLEDWESTKQQNLELMAQVERYESALDRIVKTEGKVCSWYETCTHPACESSRAAWEIASSVLKLNRKPQQSLAEHDAEVVEAFCADRFKGNSSVRHNDRFFGQQYADQLRQQEDKYD